MAEATGATVEEATAAALAELGVGEAEAEVEVLDHPRRGLFGGGRPARVRATVMTASTTADVSAGDTDFDDEVPRQEDRVTDPTTNQDAAEGTVEDAAAPDDAERRTDEAERPTDSAERPAGGAKRPADDAERSTSGDAEEELSPQERLDLLDQEAEIAADFLEGLLDLLDLPGDIEIHVREEQAIVNIAEVGSGLLIGRRGATLDALQELVRCATQRRTERRSHVRVDVEGYRERQLDKLRDKCRDAIAQVREAQEPVRLEPMDPYERKMMHDLVSKSAGVSSTSEGSEPRRRVVIEPEG